MNRLSQKSLANLVGVDPRLVEVVKKAIEKTLVDFMVGEGQRTPERQKLLVKQGKSKTLKSKHVEGRAVDLWALWEGKISWNFDHYYDIARAMQEAARELGVTIRWGGVWDKTLNEIGDPEEEVREYVKGRKEMGLSAFLDGPHFELVSEEEDLL